MRARARPQAMRYISGRAYSLAPLCQPKVRQSKARNQCRARRDSRWLPNQDAWDFYQFAIRSRWVKSQLLPEVAAHAGQRIGEGRQLLAIPGGLAHDKR